MYTERGGVCYSSEEGACTLVFSTTFFCIVQRLCFVMNLVTFKSILVLFYVLFSLNVQGNILYLDCKSWCWNFYFYCSLLVMMRAQRIKQPNQIPSPLVQTHLRKQRSRRTLDVQDQWNVCLRLNCAIFVCSLRCLLLPPASCCYQFWVSSVQFAEQIFLRFVVILSSHECIVVQIYVTLRFS